MNGVRRMNLQRNSKDALIKECNEDIEKLYQDIETLNSIIESKRQDISDLLKVIEALENLNGKYIGGT